MGLVDRPPRLKVANIIEDGRLAGPQYRIMAVARRLIGAQIETVVIHPEADSQAFQARLDAFLIPHVGLPIRRLTKKPLEILKYFLSFPVEIYRLRKLFLSQEFDLVHCSGGAWQIKGLLAAKLSGIKAVWHLNDTLLPARYRGLFSHIASLLADGIICAGSNVQSVYFPKGWNLKPLEIIQAPIDGQVFFPDPTLTRLERSSTEMTIVTVANINPLKGIETLIGAAHILANAFVFPRFLVVGPIFESQKQYFLKLQDLVASYHLQNFKFLGASDNIPAILRAADIYVCSSRFEASPTSVWEAMATGLPVVSTDVGDVSRFIQSDINGYVVLSNDSDDIAKAVLNLIRDAGLRHRLGSAARTTALQYLDIKVCTDNHERLYRRVMKPSLEPLS